MPDPLNGTAARIAGFEAFSTVDWPRRIAATVFVAGCPWRCAYCHNPGLQARTTGAESGWAPIRAALSERIGWLDGVVFSGGEPTLAHELGDWIDEVAGLGFGVGLHTAGIYPGRLDRLLPRLDWVGFDFKTEAAGYAALTGAPGSAQRVWRSAEAIIASGVDHEFRLTWHPQLVSDAAVLATVDAARRLGARRFVLQEYRASGVGNPALGPAGTLPAALAAQADELHPALEVRRN